jgi:hypothetical protein
MSQFYERPPRWTEITSEQIASLGELLVSDEMPVSADQVAFLCWWMRSVTDVLQFSEYGTADRVTRFVRALEDCVLRRELMLTHCAADMLVRFMKDPTFLVSLALQWIRDPAASIERRPWRVSYVEGVLVADASSEAKAELAKVQQYFGFDLADKLIQTGQLSDADVAILEAEGQKIADAGS